MLKRVEAVGVYTRGWANSTRDSVAMKACAALDSKYYLGWEGSPYWDGMGKECELHVVGSG